jgi:hypothetical protein
MSPLQEVPKRRVLHSWKEVAAFLGATVRSVQRWEKTAGLPVHRQGGGLKTRVYAYSDQLERWRESGQVATSEREPAPVPVLRRRWLHIAILGIAVLAAIAFLVWRGDMARRGGVPAMWRLENSTLTVMDAVGRACWMKQFPPFDPGFEAEVRDKVLIADIDGDGQREVLFNFVPANVGESGGSLMCFEQTGRLRWQYHYGSAKTFGNRSFSASYRGQVIRPVRIDGKPHLLTVANHYVWYPSQTALIDPATGRLEEEYWHPGAIRQCVLYDLDGDGQDEVLLGGINNPGDGLGHAALAVLKLPFSKAPRQSVPGDFPAVTGGGEWAYLLFPLPDVARVAGMLPMLDRLSVDKAGRIFVETPLPETGGVVYYLDTQLNVVEVRFSDNFASLHNRFFLTHLLDHRLSEAELAWLRRPARFPAAPDGNSPQLKRFWKY